MAARVGKRLTADAVAVVGIGMSRGKLSVIGSLVNLETGQAMRTAAVPLAPEPSVAQLEGIGRYLAGGDPESGIDVIRGEGGSSSHVSERSRRGPSRHRPIAYPAITSGVALVGLVAGVSMAALDDTCTSGGDDPYTCNLRPTWYKPAAVSLLATGAVAAAVSGSLWADRAPRIGMWRWVSASVSAAALVAGGVLIARDEGVTPQVLTTDPRTSYRDTLFVGSLLVGAGGLGLGFSMTQFFQGDASDSSSSAPVASVGVGPDGRPSISIAGRF